MLPEQGIKLRHSFFDRRQTLGRHVQTGIQAFDFRADIVYLYPRGFQPLRKPGSLRKVRCYLLQPSGRAFQKRRHPFALPVCVKGADGRRKRLLYLAGVGKAFLLLLKRLQFAALQPGFGEPGKLLGIIVLLGAKACKLRADIGELRPHRLETPPGRAATGELFRIPGEAVKH